MSVYRQYGPTDDDTFLCGNCVGIIVEFFLLCIRAILSPV